MNWIRNKRFISFNEGRAVILAEIQADSTEDFPVVNAYDGYTIAKGSIAQDISSGDFYCLGSDGVWYDQTDASKPPVDNTPEPEPEPDDDEPEVTENV